MNIDKAIERLTQHLNRAVIHRNPELDRALELGIEALKRAKACRPPFGRDDHSLLPGETEK